MKAPKTIMNIFLVQCVLLEHTAYTKMWTSMCMNKIFTYFPNSLDSYILGDHASMERH